MKNIIATILLIYTANTLVMAGNTEQPKGALDALDDRKQRLNESLRENNPDIQLKSIDDVAKEKGISTALPFENTENSQTSTVDTVESINDVKELTLPARDPFNLDANQSQFGGSAFLPSNTQQQLPNLRFRGVITERANAKDEDLLALLEINGRDVYMVRVGDEISYDLANPLAAIKIKTITRLNVTVQLGTLGNVVIVR